MPLANTSPADTKFLNQAADQESADEGIGAQIVQGLFDAGVLSLGEHDPNAFSTSNARASRAAALRQLTIQRKKLEFQQRTGLRDIKQARAKGIKGAINDALQRGIFRSGIRIENEEEVNREADESQSDLKTEIQFALDDLAARRQGLAAQRFGTPPQPGGLSAFEARELADEGVAAQLNAEPEQITKDPIGRGSTLEGIDSQPTTGVVQIPRGGPS